MNPSIVNTDILRAKGRIIAFIMLVIALFGAFGVLAPDAYASPAAGAGIFDIVGDDGSVDPTKGGVAATDNTADSIATVITKGRAIATGFTGIATLVMLVCMIIQFVKLGAAGDNEMSRKRAIMGIMTTGIATMLLGGVTVVVGFFWGALK